MNCYVLTGGRSSRMGRSKRELFFERVAAAARPVFDDVIEIEEQEGAPIFGVVRALRHAEAKAFILAVDYPLITSDVLRYLRDRGGVAMSNGEPQLLCAVWDKALLPELERRLAEGRFDLRGLLERDMIPESELRLRFGGQPLMNVNTPEELMAAKEFSHLDDTGGISMVNVGAKRVTQREATAAATVRMSPATLAGLIESALPKGDVLTTAKIAGVLAAKQTPALIPLSHPLALDSVDITFDLDPASGTIEVRSIVRCEGKTGVEMEAMTACAVAALTIYDMCKSAEKGIVIDGLQLVRKSGGKSGTWERT